MRHRTSRPGSSDGAPRQTRRNFLQSGAGLVAGAAAGRLLQGAVAAQAQDVDAASALRDAAERGRAILLKGGLVYSVDRQVGDFASGDVLIQGKTITAVGPVVTAPADAVVVDARGFVVMPGLIDTHHHQYETVLRSTLADAMFGNDPSDRLAVRNYRSVMGQLFTPVYTPDDARIAQLLASLSQVSQGVTTTVETSQIHLTPEHTDATIAGLRESGRRCLVAYGPNGPNSEARVEGELSRLRRQYFASDDQLLTLGQNAIMNWPLWRFGRAVGAWIVGHCQGRADFDEPAMIAANVMGPDVEYIHCTRISDALLDRIAETGGHVSIATGIEMAMGHAHPPLQECLDRGLRPSLSVDVECTMTADLFTQMRAVFTWQRAVAHERRITGDPNPPALLTCRDVIEFATIEGARCAHVDSRVGSLTPGKEADIIVLSTGLNVAPLHNVPGAIVTLMDTSNVAHVFIAGKVMKWQGEMVGVDVHRVLADARRSAEGIIARAGYTNDLFESCCPGPLFDEAERTRIGLDAVRTGEQL